MRDGAKVTFLGIPVVNRPDLLENAIRGVPANIQVYVMRNGAVGIPRCRENVADFFDGQPDVPWLTFTASMNAFQKRAERLGCDFWLHCHNDAQFAEEDVHRLATMAEQEQSNWYLITTRYDILCAYRTAAIRDIGGWDQVFSQYFSDDDLHRRAALKEYTRIRMRPHTVRHGPEGIGSQTINSDPALHRANAILFPGYRQIFIEKWGGEPKQETFPTPWNR